MLRDGSGQDRHKRYKSSLEFYQNIANPPDLFKTIDFQRFYLRQAKADLYTNLF